MALASLGCSSESDRSLCIEGAGVSGSKEMMNLGAELFSVVGSIDPGSGAKGSHETCDTSTTYKIKAAEITTGEDVLSVVLKNDGFSLKATALGEGQLRIVDEYDREVSLDVEVFDSKKVSLEWVHATWNEKDDKHDVVLLSGSRVPVEIRYFSKARNGNKLLGDFDWPSAVPWTKTCEQQNYWSSLMDCVFDVRDELGSVVVEKPDGVPLNVQIVSKEDIAHVWMCFDDECVTPDTPARLPGRRAGYFIPRLYVQYLLADERPVYGDVGDVDILCDDLTINDYDITPRNMLVDEQGTSQDVTCTINALGRTWSYQFSYET